MTHFSFGVFVCLQAQLYQKKENIVFYAKKHEILGNTEYKFINYIDRFTLTKFIRTYVM